MLLAHLFSCGKPADSANSTSSQKPDDKLYQQFKQNFPHVNVAATSSGSNTEDSIVADMNVVNDVK